MKKIIASTLVAVVFSIFSPVAPLAHAGSIQDQLTQIIAQDVSVAQIQQLLTVRKLLAQGNKQGLMEALATLDPSGQGEVTSAVTAVSQGSMSQVAENALREKIKKSITDRIAPYEQQLAAITPFVTNQPLGANGAQDNTSLTGAPDNYKRVLNMTATAYSPGTLDNGKWKDKTYMGGIVRHGVVAVDPKVIPMGTKLWVEGYGEAVAEDQGSAIKGNRIDLAFDQRTDALDYGTKNIKIYVLN